MLLSLLVGFNLRDRLFFGVAFGILHLLFAEDEDSLLLLVLGFDLILHISDELLNVGIRVGLHLAELEEARDLFILLERLAAVIEKFVRLLNVSLLELLVLVLLVRVVPLVLVLNLGCLKLILEVTLRLFSLFVLNELVVEVLQFAEVSNDAALVLLLTCALLEIVLVDFEHLQVVAKSEKVPDGTIQITHAIGAY